MALAKITNTTDYSFSDAMQRGSSMIVGQPGKVLYRLEHANQLMQRGCAIGMVVVGSNGEATLPDVDHDLVIWPEKWQWIAEEYPIAPCTCMGVMAYVHTHGMWSPRQARSQYTVLDCIAHLFDYHVFHAKDWSFDKLVNWVRQQEAVHARKDYIGPAIISLPREDNEAVDREREKAFAQHYYPLSHPSQCPSSGELGTGDLSAEYLRFVASLDITCLETKVQSKLGIHPLDDSAFLPREDSQEVLQELELVGV